MPISACVRAIRLALSHGWNGPNALHPDRRRCISNWPKPMSRVITWAQPNSSLLRACRWLVTITACSVLDGCYWRISAGRGAMWLGLIRRRIVPGHFDECAEAIPGLCVIVQSDQGCRGMGSATVEIG